MTTLLLAATLQAWFLALLLASKRRRRLADRILTVWLTLLGGHTGCLFLQQSWGPLPGIVGVLNSGFPFLQGPFLYLYVATLTSGRPRLRWRDGLHALPFLAFVIRGVASWLGTAAEPVGRHATRSLLDIQDLFGIWLLISVPLYIAACLVFLRRYRRALAAQRSNVDRITLGWLLVVVAGMGGVWLTVLVAAMVGGGDRTTLHLVFPALTLFVYVIGYFGFRQAAIFAPVSTGTDMREIGPAAEVGPDATNPPPVDPPTKYDKSGLDPATAERLHAALVEEMEKAEPWLEPELTLGELAQRVGAPPNHVSQVLNAQAGESFYDFVNGYRVRAVAARLRDPSFDRTNVLDIAFDCGFGSKSTFNRIFRERIGSTPSAYRRGRSSDPETNRRPSG